MIYIIQKNEIDGEQVLFFPQEMNPYLYDIMCYARVGGHGTANVGYYADAQYTGDDNLIHFYGEHFNTPVLKCNPYVWVVYNDFWVNRFFLSKKRAEAYAKTCGDGTFTPSVKMIDSVMACCLNKIEWRSPLSAVRRLNNRVMRSGKILKYIVDSDREIK